jgi:pyruvate dehydrogenase E2 component (dihydrolipoamide acetyltransferase)
MGEFRMPVLGADMVAGTMVEWKKRPGDHVTRGEIIAEVETDKGAIDIEVFEDGVLERICVEPGQKVPVGTVLAMINGAAPVTARPSAPSPPEPVPHGEKTVPVVPPPVPSEPGAPSRHRASPVARRIAADLGVALETLTGTGPGGVIVEADVRAAAAAAPAPAQDDRAHRMRRAIAAAMTRSKREIPHFYLLSTVDFSPATEWLSRENANRAPADRILSAVLLLKATALALLEFPELNARWENDRLTPAGAVHIGVATTLRGGGLVIPALHHVNRKTLPELMQELREVVERARTGRLRGSDLTDGTITVSSLGDRGADAVLAVIYPPQTAIIGFGSVVERPWVVAGAVLPRPVITVTLAGDHRASDGHRGAHFLESINRLLQEPAKL